MSPSSETTTTPTDTEAVRTADQGTHSPAEFELAVTLPANLHARPAGKLAQTAARFSSSIRLDYAGKSVNPTGVLAVMSLGATAGTTVTLRAQGEDAEQAVQALAAVLASAE
ncbi:MAG TPA: HPr family phosphocarrier protein [Actinocrinis sp.]|jgi:phosphotransferase system HPr (HPr) family protein|uniref:HPr family phosphocarrier protein n=1 Tax=Actinocrinis sp. TaxID=1920516 RepID=UPI002D3DF064|nr:HPr family phosphocarrier protein [Actinocrinis sp.]HZU58125.1 HPr family phosphocarrier protein [Actinocrinis sp.]